MFATSQTPGLLNDALLDSPSDKLEKPRLAALLDNDVDRFAAWRWKTLANATRDLLRPPPSLLVATPHANTAKLVQRRDGVQACGFVAAILDNASCAERGPLGRLFVLVAVLPLP